jgi:hypothetical protein
MRVVQELLPARLRYGLNVTAAVYRVNKVPAAEVLVLADLQRNNTNIGAGTVSIPKGYDVRCIKLYKTRIGNFLNLNNERYLIEKPHLARI